MKLYKTTIVIWSEYDPTETTMDASILVHEAEVGEAYCSRMDVVGVDNPEQDADWDGTEFFNGDDIGEEEC
jgi:hypothetical protein